MKTYIYLLFFLFFISCNSTYTLIESIDGTIYDKKTNIPIKGVIIYTDSFAFNFFGKIKTNKKGFFFINNMKTKDYDSYYTARKNISYKLFFESKGYAKDAIDLREYNYDKKLDSIKLGKIYLTPLTLPNNGNK
ncbi:hypothetical protein [Tenacibaculum maritimum]|uniref:hypothetical protein n=1 Tax=Tenacibaculum maritimum TaxID=107401 RepID=UPI0012E5D145|nr:hypothetical protein [Tenacibaculum maritimum]CAA0223772.1 hypothetical protein TMP445_610004 [Tenacibaculum maritimum]